MDINQDAVVHTYDTFFCAETADLFDFSVFDYVVDAVDTVSAKLLLIEKAKEAGVPVISVWEQEINWILHAFRSQIFLRPASARWQK